MKGAQSNVMGYRKRTNRVKNPVKELKRVTYTIRHTQPHLSDAEVETLAAHLVTQRMGWYSGQKKGKKRA